jgi:hypothetical protein
MATKSKRVQQKTVKKPQARRLTDSQMADFLGVRPVKLLKRAMTQLLLTPAKGQPEKFAVLATNANLPVLEFLEIIHEGGYETTLVGVADGFSVFTIPVRTAR